MERIHKVDNWFQNGGGDAPQDGEVRDEEEESFLKMMEKGQEASGSGLVNKGEKDKEFEKGSKRRRHAKRHYREQLGLQTIPMEMVPPVTTVLPGYTI